LTNVSAHELIKPAEYARRRGVTRAAVSKAILRCRIPLTDGKLDPLVADTLWQARTDPDQQARALGQQAAKNAAEPPPPTPEGTRGDDYSAVRMRQARADARMAELALEEREGSLVKKEDSDRAARRWRPSSFSSSSRFPTALRRSSALRRVAAQD
jgi:hypothetical protein